MTVYNSLSDKVVLVTGGTRGIGLSIAKEFLKYKSKVFITGTKTQPNLPKGLELKICNFLDRTKVESFIKDLSLLKIDILINNAGINKINKFVNINTT